MSELTEEHLNEQVGRSRMEATEPGGGIGVDPGGFRPAADVAGLEKVFELQDISVSYGDTPAAGAAALVFVDDDKALAKRVAERLVAEMRARRDRFFIPLPSAEQGIAQTQCFAAEFVIQPEEDGKQR